MRKAIIAMDAEDLTIAQESEPIWRLIRKLKVLGFFTVAAGLGGAMLSQLAAGQGTSWVTAFVLVGSATLISGLSMDYALWRSARDQAMADALERERVAAENK